jgi:glycosyltransferase involved in cell wall biosynthesis
VRILHVTTFIFPDLHAGAERFVRGTARAQAAAGHEVTVLAGSQGQPPSEEQTDGFRLLRYPIAKVRGFRFYRDVRSQVNARLRMIAGEGFDILHAHQIASAAPALRSSFPSHKVLSFHASYRLEFEAERLDGAPSGGGQILDFGNRLKSMAIGMLDRQCLLHAERITVHTQFVLDQVREIAPRVMDRVRIVPPGVDLERFSPGDPAAARRSFGFPEDRPLIVTVRRLARRMGLDLFLQALARLEAHGLTFAAAIGGVGPERESLERLCGELGLGPRVRFLGRVPDDQLPDLLRAADLFVLPTRSMEGFGLVTIEALACGVPVVATNTGATPEILAPIDPGLLTAPDPEALAATIRGLLSNPGRRSEVGARGVESVRSRYAWDRCVASLDGVYGELCEDAGRV